MIALPTALATTHAIVCVSAQDTFAPPPDPLPMTFGASIALCGDLDGDGCSEFAIGAPTRTGYDEGHVFVYSGRTGALLRTIDASDFGVLGSGLADVGDQDGDGVEDIALSLQNPSSGIGCVEIRSGNDGTCIRRFIGSREEIDFGGQIVPMGDVNLDGMGDLLVHARLDEVDPSTSLRIERDRWIVLSGRTGERLQSITSGVRSTGWNTACALGDVDGDCVPDFAVIYDGVVHVRSGASAHEIRALSLPKSDGGKRGAHYGLAGPGDLDGDGRADIVIGVPFPVDAGERGPRGGFVRAWSAFDGRELFTSAEFVSHSLREHREGFGFALAVIGDVDGDGIADIAATEHSGFCGDVLILSGADGHVVARAQGAMEGDIVDCGWSVAAARDIDGDGIGDVIVSQYEPFSAGVREQGAVVLSGKDGHVIHALRRDHDGEKQAPR